MVASGSAGAHAMPGLPRVDVDELEHALASTVDAEVRFDAGTRAAYSTDSSNYRQVPIGVVAPRSVDAGVRAAEICRQFDAPLLSRGGGTSLGGQCTNVAVVLDWTKYCNHLVSHDPASRTCIVEPGIVYDVLNRKLAVHGQKFGPKPSTHSHCALGGMIGNNACGASAQLYGKTVDNVRRLEILTYDGLRCWVGPEMTEDELDAAILAGGRYGEICLRLREIRDTYRDEIRRYYPDIPRRVSGYNLDSLLPDDGLDLARLLTGSEGTLVTVLHAELDLVPTVPATAMVVLGYDDIVTAADIVPELLSHCQPLQLEAVGGELTHFIREQGMFLDSLAQLPTGSSWLFVQLGAESAAQADEQARHLIHALGKSTTDDDVAISEDPEREEQMLKAREAGLGATARPPDMPESWEGWEDSAVSPEFLGDYLRDLLALFREFDYERPALYGHFGQGCVHIRSPFRLKSAPGVATFREFIRRASQLVSSYGGSLSGEHGDGQARGEMLEIMFGARLIRAFAEVKGIFDPANRMNPGKITAPYTVDENLRLGATYRPVHTPTQLGYPDDGGSFHQGVMRCVGIGNCRSTSGGVMCPSYRATGEEEHSTRGRARLLFEMMRGHDDSTITDGWRSESVKDALDLCLACKGCKSDCPTGVDMASYKAEFLSQHYRRRVRPVTHYSLGWLPAIARIAQGAPRSVNAVTHTPVLAGLSKRLAGIAPQRDVPRFARTTFQQQWRQRSVPEPRPGDRNAVVLWPDTFTNHFDPRIARATVRVLEAAGFQVAVPTTALCCGLTWISTGQLSTARHVLLRTLRLLRPWLEAGSPIVGMEPSCAAVFRSDTRELLPQDEDAARLRSQLRTLAEILNENHSWTPPNLGRKALVQTHCHQHATLGFTADRSVMEAADVDAEVLSGCCGLAGDFGFVRGHYDVSIACAEHALYPALRRADEDTVVVADGFSCRTQVAHGSRTRAVHLAELLDGSGQ